MNSINLLIKMIQTAVQNIVFRKIMRIDLKKDKVNLRDKSSSLSGTELSSNKRGE